MIDWVIGLVVIGIYFIYSTFIKDRIKTEPRVKDGINTIVITFLIGVVIEFIGMVYCFVTNPDSYTLLSSFIVYYIIIGLPFTYMGFYSIFSKVNEDDVFAYGAGTHTITFILLFISSLFVEESHGFILGVVIWIISLVLGRIVMGFIRPIEK